MLCELGSPIVKLVLPWSSVGGATHVTGSLMTPHVRRIGPDGLRGLIVSGLTIGIGFMGSTRLI